LTAPSQPHPIWLARHLPSAHASTTRITGAEFSTWSLAYDAVGLDPGAQANPELIELAQRCTVLCSPLARAVETARLAGCAVPVTAPILTRATRPDLPVPYIRLRPKTWRALTRVAWQCGWAPAIASHTETLARADQAAAELAALAAHSELLVIGHNYFNTLIGDSLQRHGWTGPSKPTTRHGRANAYHPPPQHTAPWLEPSA
jgi:broad specificity phosphatase PhoE